MQMWKKVSSFNFCNGSMWSDYTKNLNHFWVKYENSWKKKKKCKITSQKSAKASFIYSKI